MAETALLGQSALQAFRADLPVGGAAPDGEDEAAILVATLLRQHLVIPAGGPDRSRIRERAVELAKASLGAETLAAGCVYDDHPATSDVDIVRCLAQRTSYKGWVQLARHLLESLREIVVDPVDLGRLLVDFARNAMHHGELDLAQAQAEQARRHAIALRSDELIAYASSQLAGLAQIRGNFVQNRQLTEVALRHARRAGRRKLIANALGGLGVIEGIAGNYSKAVGHLWAAYHEVEGKGNLAYSALSDLAHTLMLSGRPQDARKIAQLLFAGRSAPVHIVLPALGGYAIASARVGDVAAVDWATAQVQQLAKIRQNPRQVAEAMIECAAALEITGRSTVGGTWRQQAEQMAFEFGFHDLTFREALVAIHGTPPERPKFTGVGARAEREIAELNVPSIGLLSAV